MSEMSVVYAAANWVLFLGFTAFMIFLYGRENSMIHKIRVCHRCLVKVLLCACSAGALYNALSPSEPTPSEMVLSIGLALLFVWSAWFHYVHFVAPSPAAKAASAAEGCRRRGATPKGVKSGATEKASRWRKSAPPRPPIS